MSKKIARLKKFGKCWAIGKRGLNGFYPQTIATSKGSAAMLFRLHYPHLWRWRNKYQSVQLTAQEPKP